MKPFRMIGRAVFPMILVLALRASAATAAEPGHADWPQWRGPARNGIQEGGPQLPEEWPASGLAKLWESEPIPSDDDGGHGSVVAANGRVYAALVWHTDVPTETRAIDDLVLRQLGYQSVANWPKETVENMEKTRLALDPDLIGPAFDKFLAEWLEKNLDPKTRQTSAGYVRTRFERRKDAIPLDVYTRLLTVSKKRFENEAALVAWVNEQKFGEKISREILDAVPPSMKVAEDVVVCLDLATGQTLWKYNVPGQATGRMASSTPCVADGRVYALGSIQLHAVDASSGKPVWTAPLPAKGPASSPLVVEGILVVNAGKLAAFDAATGKALWTQPKVGGGNSSPVTWKSGDRTLVICNGRGIVGAADLKSGDVLWTTPGGGDCTPAVVGDTLVVQTSNPKIGILAGKLATGGFTTLWNVPYDPLRSQSSPLIIGQQVYVMDDNVHSCFDVATGRQLWKESVSSSISSPVIADGKIIVLAQGGSRIVMIKPSPEKRLEVAKARIRALSVPSPAIADGKLLLRCRKNITCYSLTATDGAKVNP